MATSELSLIASLTHVPSPDILSPSHIQVFPHFSRTSWNVVGFLGGGGGTWAPSWFNRCILFRANISAKQSIQSDVTTR